MQQEVVPEAMRHCHVDEVFDFIVRQLMDFSARIGRYAS